MHLLFFIDNEKKTNEKEDNVESEKLKGDVHNVNDDTPGEGSQLKTLGNMMKGLFNAFAGSGGGKIS